MSTAAVNSAAAPPAGAAAPAAANQGAVTPASGQGFVPTAGTPASGASASPAADQAQGAASDGSLPAEQALKAIMQALGDQLANPVVAPDGTVYMEKKSIGASGGTLDISYIAIGTIDKQSARFTPSPQVLQMLKASQSDGSSDRKLVKVDGQWTWQVLSKAEDGSITAKVTPATDAEVEAYARQQAAAQAQQDAKDGVQNRQDWQQKLGTVAQGLGIFSSTGQFLSAISQGPDPLTGRPGAGWLTGWMLAQKLNGAAQGHLLPTWLQKGPVASTLEWGLQAYGMLNMGNDIRTLREYFGGAKLPPVSPTAVDDMVKAGTSPAMAQGLAQLGTELRTPLDPKTIGSTAAQVVGTNFTAAGQQFVDGNTSAIVRASVPEVVDAAGKKIAGEVALSTQLVKTSDLHKAYLATDPVKDAGLKAQAAIDTGVYKTMGSLRQFIQPAMIGATALGFVSSAIGLKNQVKQNGVQALLDTQAGRGAALGTVTNASYLSMYVLPMVLRGFAVSNPAIGAVSAAVSLASNVLGGVQMLNNYGLFGGDGFLNNDGFRAAFLIPPLTPIGAFAFWMKHRKDKRDAEAAKLKAAQQVAAERVKQQREMARLQLQSTGRISGATQGSDGSISVSTGVPRDMSVLAAQIAGTASSGAAPAPGTSG